ncbi:luciferase domain-containing protein [Streptomyces sp. NBC_00299]|uniref:luciferase domain-containing protein n=1 Tax=Streptomyces sp. NBC_00299 TaxID=2975705 RepID=UPI002E2DE0C8|nr:luciferase family protein [Streptomyces sp. NBC_00299]
MTLAQRAMKQLEVWPDLSPGPASCGAGRALRSVHSEIVHFHSDHDVDLHLTVSAIRRFHADLQESTAIRLVPGSGWVTVHLDCDTDVDLLMSLVSAALKADQSVPSPAGKRPAGDECNFRRVTVLPRR